MTDDEINTEWDKLIEAGESRSDRALALEGEMRNRYLVLELAAAVLDSRS
ncbi:MAG: hypothetical protein AB1781_11055 [Pseudomonadota bacterium]